MVTLLALLVACGGGDEPVSQNTSPDDGVPAPVEPAPAAPDAEGIERLAPHRLLVRASLDLRGVRPSDDELERIEADPDAYEELVDEFLADERFADRVMDLFAEVTLTRTEQYFINLTAYGVEDVPAPVLYESIGSEALQVIGEVARHDLPITELVTADWTMANEVTARLWPLDYPDGETGWKRAHYTDGRPAAGILSGTGIWWRYRSTDSNANRKRANQASRILLCNDYLVRPIDFDRNVNLLDEEAIADALKTNPGCVNCHVSLDPLAAYFFGFTSYNDDSTDAGRYHPAREREGEDVLGVTPAFYGDPGSSLADLGWQIAADHRFPQCMTEHVTELLLRRDAELLDFERLTAHREALLAGGLALRPLFRSVVTSPEYVAATDEGLPGTQVPLKMVTPPLLASQVEGLTGFTWTADGWDLLGSDLVGFLTLAGGADGSFVTQHAKGPNVTLLLVQERLAEGAASHVIDEDLVADTPRLFDVLSPDTHVDDDPDGAAEQIAVLHRRIFGTTVALDGPEVTANLELWHDLYAIEGDPVAAWTGLLTALLRDPDFLLY
jgi:hypothetical protein